MVKVTQEDRDAAAALIVARPIVENPDIITHGGADDGGFVQAFAQHRQSAIAELCEGLDAEFASAAQKLEVPEGHPDKPQRDFAIGVLWALQEAIHTRALLSPGSAGTRATESGDGDEA